MTCTSTIKRQTLRSDKTCRNAGCGRSMFQTEWADFVNLPDGGFKIVCMECGDKMVAAGEATRSNKNAPQERPPQRTSDDDSTKRIESLVAGINNFETSVQQRFDKHNQRLGGMERLYDRHEQRIKELEEKIELLTQQLAKATATKR